MKCSISPALARRCTAGADLVRASAFCADTEQPVWTAGGVSDGLGAFHRTPFLDIPERKYE